MVNRCISPQVKELAIDLWINGFSMSDVCQIFHVSPRSLYRWRSLFDDFGSVTPPPSPLRGRPRTIGLAAMTAVRQLYEQHPYTYLDELQWFLAIHHDTAISISSLQDNLQKAGLTRKLLHKIAIERDEELRAHFRAGIRDLQHFSGTGKEFVAVDESSKDERTFSRQYGRAPIGQSADFSDVFVRGDRYSLVAAMSTEGYLAVQVKEGSFDTESFFSFIVDDLIPLMNPYPEKHSVLILDNCRIHHTEVLRETLEACGIMLLYLPPYSPDLNPIEESFSTWKAYLRRNGSAIRAADDPAFALLDSCGCVTEEMATGWFYHAGYIVHV